jgi:transketolase
MLEKYKQKYPHEGKEFMPQNQIRVDATRGYSEKCLNRIEKVIPGLIGGSVDLASSNKVYLKEFEDFKQARKSMGPKHPLWCARTCNGWDLQWNCLAC